MRNTLIFTSEYRSIILVTYFKDHSIERDLGGHLVQLLLSV